MTIPSQQARVRQAVLLGLFVGTAVGLGFLLAGVPNVELMTLTVALAGAALGPAGGFAAGALAETCFSLANPLGAALPVLLASQVLGMGLAGFLGGLTAPLVLRWSPIWRVPAAAVLGGSVTLLFDVLTNLATAVTLRADLVVTLAAGIPFALVHVGANTAIFAVLWPTLAPRLRRLRQPALRAGAVAWLCAAALATSPEARAAEAMADSLVAPADTTTNLVSAPVDSSGPQRKLGWQKPLWDPFFAGFVNDLTHHSAWTAVRDGDFGARVQLFGEPGSSPAPAILRSGLPVQTGHRYVDDLAAVPLIGYRLAGTRFGGDGRGGMDGVVEQVLDDPSPQRALTDTRFHAGGRDDLFRSVHLLTADAPWRLQLAIEEQLDMEGYDFRRPNETRYDAVDDREAANFPGHAKFRSGLGQLQRQLPDGSRITVGFENVRKLKSLLPSLDLDHQDLWLQRAGADWRRGTLRAAAYWIDADVDWDRPTTAGNPAPRRRTESGREGLILAAGPLQATLEAWDVSDTGADAAWAGDAAGPRQGRGEQASVAGRHTWAAGPLAATASAEAWWDSHSGWRPAAEVTASAEGLALSVARGGRAPRSDERLTAWRFDVPGGTPMVWRPGDDLAVEKTWRAEASANRRLLGLDLAAVLALRRLEDGLGWRPDSPGAVTGQTANGLGLDSQTLRMSVSREGRFLGWVRVHAQASLRGWSRDGDVRIALPPRRDWRVAVMWENHLFQEDGILEAAWVVEHRGAMEDPWYLAAPIELAPYTLHDAYLGFRLVGTHLGVAFMNVLDTRAELSAGALSPGRQMRWRLHWTFVF
jgi:hypothetical protein